MKISLMGGGGREWRREGEMDGEHFFIRKKVWNSQNCEMSKKVTKELIDLLHVQKQCAKSNSLANFTLASSFV